MVDHYNAEDEIKLAIMVGLHTATKDYGVFTAVRDFIPFLKCAYPLHFGPV